MYLDIKNDEYYLYKAKKYHHKIKQKLLEMKKNGKQLPSGYEQYLNDFKMVGGASPYIKTKEDVGAEEHFLLNNHINNFKGVANHTTLSTIKDERFVVVQQNVPSGPEFDATCTLMDLETKHTRMEMKAKMAAYDIENNKLEKTRDAFQTAAAKAGIRTSVLKNSRGPRSMFFEGLTQTFECCNMMHGEDSDCDDDCHAGSVDQHIPYNAIRIGHEEDLHGRVTFKYFVPTPIKQNVYILCVRMTEDHKKAFDEDKAVKKTVTHKGIGMIRKLLTTALVNKTQLPLTLPVDSKPLTYYRLEG